MADVDPQPISTPATDVHTQLLLTYYQCARAEIVQRVTNRDASVSFFLAGSGAVFGVALGGANLVGLLYVVPAFGLGLSLIYSQHDHVIGAITRYLATEYQDQIDTLPLTGVAPIHWDLSRERRALKSGYRLRIATVTILVTLPQAIAVAVAGGRLGVSVTSILGTLAGATTILFGVLIQLWVEARRQRFYKIAIEPRVTSLHHLLPADPQFLPAEPPTA